MKFGRAEVSAGFLILLAWLNYLDDQHLLPAALAASALHELGHYLAVRWYRRGVTQLRITVSGAEMQVAPALSHAQEAIVALAGPGVNLLLAFFLCRMEGMELFAGLNFVLGCFNMLPLGRLDGGRVLFCLLSLLVASNTAERARFILDGVMTFTMLSLGILLVWFCGNVTMLFVGVWQLNTVLPIKKERDKYCLYSPNRVK